MHTSLLVRIGGQTCALPLEHVEETMRPQPVRVMSGAPQFVRGLAMIRGTAIPVVDLAAVLGRAELPPARFVTVKAAGRRVALAVEQVLGVRDVPPESIEGLPPLLAQAGEGIVAAIGTLDAELLIVLRSARLISEETWAHIEAGDA